MKNIAAVGATFLLLTGCLKTRQQLRGDYQDPTPQRQTTQQQREQVREKAPPTAYRFEEIDEQMRQLTGRIDTVENQVAQLHASGSTQREAEMKDQQLQNQKLLVYEDALKKLEAQMLALSQELERLKAPPVPAAAAKTGSAAVATKSSYDEGEEQFNSKKWREAIVSYQKYRDNNPKGRNYADATYKMGVAFHELGMKDEARAFLEEVKDKFPNSKEAKKAVLRMKSIK